MKIGYVIGLAAVGMVVLAIVAMKYRAKPEERRSACGCGA